MYEDIIEQEYKEKMGKYIVHMRERAGIDTSKELASKLHVSTAIVSNWECGIKMPSYLYSLLLANMFNVSIDDFYDLKDIYEPNDKKPISRLIGNKAAFSKLKYQKQKEVLSEYIQVRKQLKNEFSKLCNGEEIDKERFLELSKIVGVYLGNDLDIFLSYNNSYSINIIEKIDKEFEHFRVDEKTINKLSIDKDVNHIFEMKSNLNNFLNDRYFYSDTINNTKEISDYFISKDPINGDNDYFVIDSYGNRAFVRRIEFSLYDCTMPGLLDEFIKKIKILKQVYKYDNVLSDLVLLDSGEVATNILNEYVYALLFNEKFYGLLDDFVQSLTPYEKYRILKKYRDECEHKGINLNVLVLYKFLSNDAKMITDFDPFTIHYDIESTYRITIEVMKSIYNHKEGLSIDILSKV